MNATGNKNSVRASKILEHIEGTLIADLRSLNQCALSTEAKGGRGGLNYTLFLVGLIGCETLGRYAHGAELDKKDEPPDVGAYISQFIEKYFENKDQYKWISKILSDYLRHMLVHGFAPRKDGYPFDLSLVVSQDGKDVPPLASEKNKRLAIKLDGVSFVTKIIKAFDQMKKEAATDAELARKIVAAEDYCKTVTPPKAVSNQFLAYYPKLRKTES